MRVNLKMIKDMVTEYLCGKMVGHMMANGEMENNMEEEYLKMLMVQN
jgi:hypothetical protein